MSEPQQRPLDAQVIENARAAAQSAAPGQPQVVVVQQAPPGGTWGRVFRWVGLIALLFFVPMVFGLIANRQDYLNPTEGLTEKFVSGDPRSTSKIAVIEVTGIIEDGQHVRRQINRARRDDQVKAVVVRIDSPGGTVTGSDFIHHHLTRLREERDLPIVASMGGLAASGGYYVAMAVGNQENSIYAEPTTTTGSIGVIIPHYDLSGLLERLNIKDDSLVTHHRKKLLSMTTAMSEDHREVLMSYLDQAFQRFKEVVKGGRPALRENPDALDMIATGEIFAAQKAQELGLVDRIGFLEDAVARAAELAGLDPEQSRVVRYEGPPTLQSLLGLQATQAAQPSWPALPNLATPRAWYLFTALPY